MNTLKTPIIIGAALFVLGIFLGLIQMWFDLWRPALFSKLEITVGALFMINLVIGFTQKAYAEFKHQQSNDKLDD